MVNCSVQPRSRQRPGIDDLKILIEEREGLRMTRETKESTAANWDQGYGVLILGTLGDDIDGLV